MKGGGITVRVWRFIKGIVILLADGVKQTQINDIKKALRLARNL